MKKQKKGPSDVSSTTIFRMVFVPLVSIIVMTLAVTGFGIDQNSSAQGQGSDNATNTDNNNNTNLGSNNSTANSTAPSTITLPVSKGFVDGKVAYFIATDASSKEIVSSVSGTTNFKVNYAPSLADTPQSSRQQAYVFINGVKGEGSKESQLTVASALPGDVGYSPLLELNFVKWDA